METYAYVLLVTYYIIKGGFRSVTGICFWGIVLPIFVVFFLIYPMKYAHFRNILPILHIHLLTCLYLQNNPHWNFWGLKQFLSFIPLLKKENL